MASKSLLAITGVTGAGAAGVGGYMTLTRGREIKTTVTKQKETFEDKYSKAILKDGDSLWDVKFEVFKGSRQPTNQKLIDAKSKHSLETDKAKELHKQGCKEIYSSSIENSTYLEDFKTYCSKNLKDAMGNSKSWITQGKEDGTWNPKLKSLSSHNPNQNGILDKALSDLKTSLSGITSDQWTEDQKQNLKNWCDSSQLEVFMGDKDPKFIHSGLYCLSN